MVDESINKSILKLQNKYNHCEKDITKYAQCEVCGAWFSLNCHKIIRSLFKFMEKNEYGLHLVCIIFAKKQKISK